MKTMTLLTGNEKTMDQQAKVCVMVDGDARAIARARGWHGTVGHAFVRKVGELRAARMADFCKAFNSRGM